MISVLFPMVGGLFDRECPACGPIPDSNLLLHHQTLFTKFVQYTKDGTKFDKSPILVEIGVHIGRFWDKLAMVF